MKRSILHTITLDILQLNQSYTQHAGLGVIFEHTWSNNKIRIKLTTSPGL